MLPFSLALATSATIVLTLLVGLYARRSATAAVEMRAKCRRHDAYVGELSRYIDSRRTLADVADTAGAAVNLGNTVTRSSHEVIAAIPFEVLENIPATSETAKAVREVHDATAAVVYDAIGTVNQALGAALRRRLTGKDQPEK
ncbi:hypothetical protein FOS14_00895 [Skermania sp. ID1734]|uniref:hypothetical protein n=1 Tax=Skermania sp. ID1734 TaxID=2597516 RepID=UPI00117E30D4|nr:hypothetical protein [Skermania sp. ID1734]TSE01982.1 hypothetical protein FOS14_00895 [Skermania sp. ID1734]